MCGEEGPGPIWEPWRASPVFPCGRLKKSSELGGMELWEVADTRALRDSRVGGEKGKSVGPSSWIQQGYCPHLPGPCLPARTCGFSPCLNLESRPAMLRPWSGGWRAAVTPRVSHLLCNKSPHTSGFKQRTFILSHFLGAGVQARFSWSSAQGPTRL